MRFVCFNELTITGPPSELDRFLTAAQGKTPETKHLALSLHALVPMSATLAKQPVWWRADWCRLNWGTPHDVVEVSRIERLSERRLFIAFETDYSVPDEAFTNIVLAFPKLTFLLKYREEIGNIGDYRWKGGRLVPHLFEQRKKAQDTNQHPKQ